MDLNTPTTQQNTKDIALAKNIIANFPTYSKDTSFNAYTKQLVEMRSVAYHQHTLRLLEDERDISPEEKKRFVIKRVARDLWTNFCIRGQNTAMLRHLHTRLCQELNKDLKFHYPPGSIELSIMETANGTTLSVSREDHINIVNKAWEISLFVVASYAI